MNNRNIKKDLLKKKSNKNNNIDTVEVIYF